MKVVKIPSYAIAISRELKTCSFTNVNLACTICLGHRESMRGFFLCNFAGIFTSFHAAGLVDRSVFRRIALKKRLEPVPFWIANFCIHILPFVLMGLHTYRVSRWDGILSALFHLLWGFCVSPSSASKDLFNLNDVYVALDAKAWKKLWCVALSTEVLFPYLWNLEL